MAVTLGMSLEGIKWENATVDYETFFVQGKGNPSRADDVSLEEELHRRYLGAHMIQRAGRLLKM